MTVEEAQQIIEQVRYKDWRFVFEPVTRELRVQFTCPDAVTGKEILFQGRPWRISKFATRSEVVQSCLLAVLVAEEHEARERFLYRGAVIFGPHFDVDHLVTICDPTYQDVRPEPQLDGSIFS